MAEFVLNATFGGSAGPLTSRTAGWTDSGGSSGSAEWDGGESAQVDGIGGVVSTAEGMNRSNSMLLPEFNQVSGAVLYVRGVTPDWLGAIEDLVSSVSINLAVPGVYDAELRMEYPSGGPEMTGYFRVYLVQDDVEFLVAIPGDQAVAPGVNFEASLSVRDGLVQIHLDEDLLLSESVPTPPTLPEDPPTLYLTTSSLNPLYEIEVTLDHSGFGPPPEAITPDFWTGFRGTYETP